MAESTVAPVGLRRWRWKDSRRMLEMASKPCRRDFAFLVKRDGKTAEAGVVDETLRFLAVETDGLGFRDVVADETGVADGAPRFLDVETARDWAEGATAAEADDARADEAAVDVVRSEETATDVEGLGDCI